MATKNSQEQSQPLLHVDEDSSHRDSGSRRGSDSIPVEWANSPSAARRRRIVRKLGALVRPAHLLSIAKRLGYTFVPTLIRSQVFDDHAPKGKEFPTSYLNGLRGMTALKVFTFHYMMAFTDSTFEPFGMDERHTYILEMPIIRYFYSGFTSHIFFGLAGYLTSLRLFQLLDKNETASQARVLLSVSGSLFRRAFRLYLPVALITLIMAIYIHMGWYETNRLLLLDHDKLFPGDWNETRPQMYPTWSEQLHFWGTEMYDLSNIVNPATVYPLHDQHLWSILAEMRASLHLYGCLIALAQVKRNIRLICLCVLVGVYFYWNHWEIWVYILGAVVAQIDLMLTDREQEKKNLPVSEKTEDEKSSLTVRLLELGKPLQIPSPAQISPSTWRFGRYAGFICAFYLLSYPIHGSRDYAPGYIWLNALIPEWMARKDKFYANWGTFLLLLLLVRGNPNTSRWRALCSHWLPQYLGKISFALYLVQAIIMHSFGYLLPHRIWWSFGVQGKDVGDMPWLGAILIGWSFTLAVTLWAADCWTREVESRCIKAVKWLEVKCFR